MKRNMKAINYYKIHYTKWKFSITKAEKKYEEENNHESKIKTF